MALATLPQAEQIRLRQLHGLGPQRRRGGIPTQGRFQIGYPTGLRRRHQTQALDHLGNVKADVLADKDPGFHRGNFCSVFRNSPWPG
jgi:hypothetical protein